VTLTAVLEHPEVGVVAPMVTGGTLDCQLDRYPRYRLTLDIRPQLGKGIEAWQTPYGTICYLLDPDGGMVFTGPVHEARATRPDGGWTLTAADNILMFSQFRWPESPNHKVGADLGMVDLPQWIRNIAASIGIPATVTGSGGQIDPRTLDLSGMDGWQAVEEQAIANNLDIYPQGDGSLLVAPTAALKASPEAELKVGYGGSITAWDVTMRRRINMIEITHQAQKTGQSDKYIPGLWEDRSSPSGIDAVGPVVYTQTVRVGAAWWDDPIGHWPQANANANAVAQTMRGIAREAVIEAIPDYSLKLGQTVKVQLTADISDVFLVTGLSWPLGPGPMTVNCRNPDPGRLSTAPPFLRTPMRARP
jgi:hypothetical protein